MLILNKLLFGVKCLIIYFTLTNLPDKLSMSVFAEKGYLRIGYDDIIFCDSQYHVLITKSRNTI